MPTDNANRGDDSYRTGGASRPSLLGPGKFSDTRPGSILHTLEKPQAPAAGQQPAGKSSGLVWKLGVLALVIVGGLAWTQWRARQPTPTAPSATSVVQSSTGVVQSPNQAVEPVASQASASTGEAVTAARIEQLPTEAQQPSVAETVATGPVSAAASTSMASSTTTPTDHKSVPAQANASGASGSASGVVAPAMAGAVVAAAAAKSQETPAATPATAASKAKSAGTPEARVAQTTPRSKSSSNVAAANARADRVKGVGKKDGQAAHRDTDVDIVSALIAGIDATPPGDNLAIADLVGSCRGGNSKEALACRARICKGYWGKADACPVRNRKAAERAARELQPRNS